MINCGSGSGSSSGLPCGTCKFLRRKCVPDCIFAPYFGCEQGAARFAAIHKIFGASSVSKLLLHVPVLDKFEAVVTIAYEAQARIRDPIYGCVEHFFTLQQQAAMLQAQLMQVRAQLAHGMAWQDLGRLSINGNGTLKLTPIRTQIYSPCLSRARPIAAAMGFWCKRCTARRISPHKLAQRREHHTMSWEYSKLWL